MFTNITYYHVSEPSKQVYVYMQFSQYNVRVRYFLPSNNSNVYYIYTEYGKGIVNILCTWTQDA